MTDQINAFFGAATDGQYTVEVTDNAITITNGSAAAINLGLRVTEGGTAGAPAGSAGLAGLSQIDVTTTTGATEALTQIEGYIQTAIDASAQFGAAASRITTQVEFVSGLIDSLKTGVGALVDADMEEASARLQALQVQQQLGIQSLSIANSSPQSVLRLFQ